MHVVASTLSDPLGETSHWTGALMWKAATVSPVWWALLGHSTRRQ